MFAELVRWPKIKICMSWVEIYIKNCVKKDGRSLSQRHYTQCWLLMYRPNVICCSSHGELKCHYITRFPSHYHIHDTKNPNRWVWVGLQVSWYKAKFLPQILLLLAGQRISSSPASQIIWQAQRLGHKWPERVILISTYVTCTQVYSTCHMHKSVSMHYIITLSLE